MLEQVIVMLLWLCVIAAAVYLVLWVLAEIGIALPPQVVKIFWIIAVLLCLLLLVRTFGHVLPAIGR